MLINDLIIISKELLLFCYLQKGEKNRRKFNGRIVHVH